MDEKTPELTKGDILPSKGQVYRTVLTKQRDKKNKAVPAVSCFSLSKKDENRLSVDWAEKTSPAECVGRFGASYKFGTTEYKPYKNREVYAIDIDFLNAFPEVEKLTYDPLIFNPPQKGKVNNPAHSLIEFEKAFANNTAKEPEVLVKIRNHAKDQKQEIDWDEVEKLVVNYKGGN